MKVYAKHLNQISHGGETYTKGPDGAFEVPSEAIAELQPFGITTEAPEQEDDPSDILVQLAKKTKAEIAAYAQEAYGVELDTKANKDTLLLQVAELAANAADEAVKAERIAELEAIPEEDRTEEQTAELAALQGEE